jgi:hypothetical protein
LKKILFVNTGHVKSLTDTFAYCKYLKNLYNITYIGFEENQEEFIIEGISIFYIKGYGNTLTNKLNFLRLVLEKNKEEKYDFVLIHYYKGASLLRFFGMKHAFLDIRSSCISKSLISRIISNILMRFEASCFRNISVISEGLREYLRLPKRACILPLGADFLDINNNTTGFKLLYVGTFHERNIVNTIRAFAKFIDDYNISDFNKVSYTIIGHGSDADILNINQAIMECQKSSFIKYLGVIRYPELSHYLLNHNVGVSYIPIKDYFNFQPPTKTFEYLLNGLVVIGTNTYEHQKLINASNGILVNDSIDEFCEAIKKVYDNFKNYNLVEIQKSSTNYSWENIITKRLIPLIESI